MGKKVPITEEQRRLSYAKYYDQDMAPVPSDKLALLETPMDPAKALNIHDRNRLFDEWLNEFKRGITNLGELIGSVHTGRIRILK